MSMFPPCDAPCRLRVRMTPAPVWAGAGVSEVGMGEATLRSGGTQTADTVPRERVAYTAVVTPSIFAAVLVMSV